MMMHVLLEIRFRVTLLNFIKRMGLEKINISVSDVCVIDNGDVYVT